LELNGVVVEVEGSPIGPLRTVSSPINVQGIEKTQPRFGPGVGEHTREILQGLGYSQEAIQELLDCGVVTAGKR
jgi:crotonobetainyl-CoA:carnitine CoA-transferase CaiB-like acyl-CoA transferase